VVKDHVPDDLFHQAHIKIWRIKIEPQINNNEPEQEVRRTELVKSFPIIKIVYFILGILETSL